MSETPETSLLERLRERIRREGAISFRDWMQAALYDEREGYYCRASVERWGRAGDYRTSPERSPLFAATFARRFAELYEEAGSPVSWTIFEAGAGAGHFARGVLESLARFFPAVFSRTRYVIEERSADARSLIEDRLAPFASSVEIYSPHENSARFDNGVVFANELLDAFPVHRVTLSEGLLRELFVTLDEHEGFTWIEREPSTPELAEYLDHSGIKLAEGQTAEVNLLAVEWLRRAATLFNRGSLIIVDYGAEASELYNPAFYPQGTLRAFKQHRFVEDALAAPGEVDLTTNIDWTSVKRACTDAGLKIVSFERQDRFLLRAGLLECLAQLTAETQSDAASLQLSTTAREMVLPGGMSASFQVLVARK